MKYCWECGNQLELRWDDQDSRHRQMCPTCNEIRYENPRILVATMLGYQDKLLLCRRAAAPSAGMWNPPSGFMEMGETLEEAAVRETLEETGVSVDSTKLDLYTVTSLAKISEVYVCFRAMVTSELCVPGKEALEARFFNEVEVPWNNLAYPEMASFLRLYFRECAAKAFGIHLSRVDASGRFRNEYRLHRAVE